MGYIDDNLITDEAVMYRARLHWIVFLKPASMSVLIGTVAALVFYAVSKSTATGPTIWEWAGAAVLVLSILVIPILIAGMDRSSAEFAVTNRRVILKHGFVRKRTAEMFLNKIESVGVDQTVMGRMVGYGSIVIRGTGGSLEPFDRISAPLEFRRQIQEQIGRASGQ